MMQPLPVQLSRARCVTPALPGVCLLMLLHTVTWAMPANIPRGQPLPDATLAGANNAAVSLDDMKGRVRIFSIVPQLNTPVCDEQTHRFSEQKKERGRDIEIVTVSTNTHKDQAAFAEKAGITNIMFLSDAPRFDFGEHTGLLYPGRHILQRAVIVTDEHNIVRYVEIVPMSQLPNVTAAMDAARRLLALTSFAMPARNGAPQQRNPHGDASDAMTDAMNPPPGIIGIALHLTAERVGSPAGLFIRATHPMGPAVNAGLMHGQEILAVDGQSLTGKTYREVVGMIRGDVGTAVTLLVKTMNAVNEVEIVRVAEDSLLNTRDHKLTHPGKRHS